MVDEERKESSNERFAQNISTDVNGAICLILKNHASAPVEKIMSLKKARGWVGGNVFVEKSGVPGKAKSFEKSIVERIVVGG